MILVQNILNFSFRSHDFPLFSLENFSLFAETVLGHVPEAAIVRKCAHVGKQSIISCYECRWEGHLSDPVWKIHFSTQSAILLGIPTRQAKSNLLVGLTGTCEWELGGDSWKHWKLNGGFERRDLLTKFVYIESIWLWGPNYDKRNKCCVKLDNEQYLRIIGHCCTDVSLICQLE